MALILNIESSTEVCSVALAQNGEVLAILENPAGLNHSTLLTVFIEEIFRKLDIEVNKLDALAVSGGPGSYTGLRIGVAAAKGICYALNLPMIAISSLASMTHHVNQNINHYQLPEMSNLCFCPMIDARRMEVYTALFNRKEEMIRKIQADIIDASSFSSLLEEKVVVFFGNGAEKCRNTIQHPNAIFIDNVLTSSAYMTSLSEKAFLNKQFVDIAYYEPYYLKDFVATIPTKNIY